MSGREVVSLPGGGGNIPLSPGIKIGNLLFASGQVGVDRKTRDVPDDVGEQTRNCFRNLGAVLEAAGVGFEDVVKVHVFLTDMDDFRTMNEAYREFFPIDPPARTTVGIKGLVSEKFKVEIDLIAAIGEGECDC